MLNAIVKTRIHILATSLLLLVGQTAVAETFVCDDGFCVFGPTDVLDNVLVEGDGILLLDGTTVTGNVHVRDGGVLAATIEEHRLCDGAGRACRDGNAAHRGNARRPAHRTCRDDAVHRPGEEHRKGLSAP